MKHISTKQPMQPSPENLPKYFHLQTQPAIWEHVKRPQQTVDAVPIVNFRWDQLSSMQFKWLSIREITPPHSHDDDTTGYSMHILDKKDPSRTFYSNMGYMM